MAIVIPVQCFACMRWFQFRKGTPVAIQPSNSLVSTALAIAFEIAPYDEEGGEEGARKRAALIADLAAAMVRCGLSAQLPQNVDPTRLTDHQNAQLEALLKAATVPEQRTAGELRAN